MTREEAKRLAQGLITGFKCKSETMVEFCNVVIEALKAEPCEDAVSRKAANDAIEAVCDRYSLSYGDSYGGVAKALAHALDNIPSVQPERPKGEWIKTPKAVMGEGFLWYCSKCQKEVYQDTSRNYPSENFCPRCGANMRGE